MDFDMQAMVKRGLSAAQIAALRMHQHLAFASVLEDGDVLVLDRDGPDGGTEMATFVAHYGPYVLCRDGKLQDVNDHYVNQHDVDAVCWMDRRKPCTVTKSR